MSRVLIVNSTFLPGTKAGGPIRTIKNMCDVFGRNNDIFLVTQNVDYESNTPYKYDTNKWLDLYGIKVMYVPPKNYNYKLFSTLYEQFDTVYTCGLFCRGTINLLLIHSKRQGEKLYIAPMGVFSKGALSIHYIKKKLFLLLFSAIGALKHIIWSFSSVMELEDARSVLGNNIRQYIIAEDLPSQISFDKPLIHSIKLRNKLNVIFLSRIVKKKNLLYALEILSNNYDGEIFFDIYGFIEDINYWHECENVISRLPGNVHCNYCGSVKPEESIDTFSKYDVFLFPTKGENYGHVIFESLAAGCIPIISDQTPWTDLDIKQCGSVIDLNNRNMFVETLQQFLYMEQDDINKYRINAVNYAKDKYNYSVEHSGYKEIFD